MVEAFLLEILLIITFFAALILSVRQLLKSYYKSLLAWYTFVYSFVMNIATMLLPYTGLPDFYIIEYDQLIVNRIYYGLILINSIAFGFLLFIDQIFSKKKSPAYFTHTASLTIPAMFKTRFKILYFIILLALIYLSTSPEIMETIEDLKGIVQSRDYAYYYGIRSIATHKYIDPLSLSIPIKLIIFDITVPLMCLYSLYGWLLTKKYIWLQRWFFSLFIWLMISIITIQKGPILELVLSNFILLIFMQYEKGKIRNFKSLLKKIVAYSLPLFIPIFGLYAILGFEGNLLFEVLKRVIFEPIYTTYTHFATFPDAYPHLSLSSSKLLSALSSDGQPVINEEPYQLVAMTATGAFFNANTSMLGTGWAKAGYWGIAQNAVLLFGVLLCWDIYLRKSKRQLLLVPLVSLYLGRANSVLNVGTNNMLISFGFLIIPLIYIIIFHKQSRRLTVLQKRISIIDSGTCI